MRANPTSANWSRAQAMSTPPTRLDMAVIGSVPAGANVESLCFSPRAVNA